MEKIKENFKKYSTVYIVVLLLLVIIGVSYAIFAVTNLSNENTISLGQISMSYTEPENALVLENALPMGNAEGMAQSNYFEFKVMTHATTDADDSGGLIIPYEINLGEIETDADKQALTKDQIKVYLTKVVSGSEEKVVGPILLSNLTESSTSDLNIYQARDIHRNADSEITTTYRLRAWIDEDVDSSIFGSQVYQYKFRVNINSATSPIVLSNLASNWQDYTENVSFRALYTLDTTELPESKIYNDVTYTKTEEIDASEQQNGSVILGIYQNSSSSIYIGVIGQNGGVIAPEDSSYLFSFNNLTVETFDLSSLNTSRVTDMEGMFYRDRGLKNIIFGKKFDTSNVTNMVGMFAETGLTTLDLSTFNTSKVINMQSMFYSSSIESLDLSNFDTKNVTNMDGMFYACPLLTDLKLSDFDTRNVTDMGAMFAQCGLTYLDLSSFDTSNVTDMGGMFTRSSDLQQVVVGCNWTTENADTSNMFDGAGVSEVTVVC